MKKRSTLKLNPDEGLDYTRRASTRFNRLTISQYRSFNIQSEFTFINDQGMVLRKSPDSKYWAIGFFKGAIRIYSNEERTRMQQTNHLKVDEEVMSVTDLAFVKGENSECNELLAAYISGCIRLWAFKAPKEGGQLIRQWEEMMEVEKTVEDTFATKSQSSNIKNQILCISLSLNNKRFATGGHDAVIRVYKYKEPEAEVKKLCLLVNSKIIHGHTSRVMCVKYHPGADKNSHLRKFLFSASWDGTVQIWDDRSGASIWRYIGPTVCSSDALDIDPTHNILVTGSWIKNQPNIELWYIPTFFSSAKRYDEEDDEEYTEDEHDYTKPFDRFNSEKLSTMPYAIKLFGNSRYLFYGGANEHLAKVIDLKTHIVVGELTLPNGVYSVDCSFDPEDGLHHITFITTECAYFCTFRPQL